MSKEAVITSMSVNQPNQYLKPRFKTHLSALGELMLLNKIDPEFSLSVSVVTLHLVGGDYFIYFVLFKYI